MKKTTPLALLGLSLASLGLYVLFWEFKVSQILNKKTKRRVPSIAWLIAPLILSLGALAYYLSEVSSNRPIATSINNNVRTVVTSNPGGVSASLFVLITAVFSLLAVHFYWQLRFAQSIKSFSHNGSPTWASFLLLFGLPFIGIIRAQDTLTSNQSGEYIDESTAELKPDRTPTYNPVVAKIAVKAALMQQTSEAPQKPAMSAPVKTEPSGSDLRTRFRNYSPQSQAVSARPMPVF